MSNNDIQRNSAVIITGYPAGNIHISASDSLNVVKATNNRAQYYAELAQKYKNDAKDYRDSAQYYAEQNADVTLSYVDGVKTELQMAISQKQNAGNYALKSELPTKVSDLTNDSSYATSSDVSTAVSNGVSPVSTAVENLSTATTSALGNKAGLDLSNVNATGTSTGAGWAMPSDTYEDVTLGASGATYTSPANGWFIYGANGAACVLQNTTANITAASNTIQNYTGCSAYIPASKNDTVALYYSGTTDYIFKFIYAVGSESEAS